MTKQDDIIEYSEYVFYVYTLFEHLFYIILVIVTADCIANI